MFSIDPSTARDLDDALSIEPLGEGRWRVGVHIADVAHFIPPGSKLDQAASERATSVYMVQQVYHMLPRLLCEQLCSLHYGKSPTSQSLPSCLLCMQQIYCQCTDRNCCSECVPPPFTGSAIGR